MQPGARMTVVERPRHMRQHELAARVATAQPLNHFHIARISDPVSQHDVQHHDTIMVMTHFPHPLRSKGFDLRLPRVRHVGIKTIGLDADKHAAAHQAAHFRLIIGGGDEHQGPRVGREINLRLHPRIFTRAIISCARITEEQSLHLPSGHPARHRFIKITPAVTPVRIEKHRTLSLREMARVKQM